MNDLDRMKELIHTLNETGKLITNRIKVMSNLEYDKMYDELLELKKTNCFIKQLTIHRRYELMTLYWKGTSISDVIIRQDKRSQISWQHG